MFTIESYLKLPEKEIDQIIPPFTETRKQIRSEWNIHCKEKGHVNWDRYLNLRALEITYNPFSNALQDV